MIELSHVQKTVGHDTVVGIKALAVGVGAIAAVVGPVGCGKSALLVLLTGQSRPTVGTVGVAGFDPSQDGDQLAQQVGVLFAENGRAHCGYLVNLERVKAVIPYIRGSFTLVLDDSANAEIRLSKASARELRDQFGY